MTKKPISCTQVRLEVEVARDVRVMWTSFEAKTSLTSFTNMLIRRGMEVSKPSKPHPGDSGESVFKK